MEQSSEINRSRNQHDANQALWKPIIVLTGAVLILPLPASATTPSTSVLSSPFETSPGALPPISIASESTIKSDSEEWIHSIAQTRATLAQIEPTPKPTLPPPDELIDESPTVPSLDVPVVPLEPDMPAETEAEGVTIVVNRFAVEGSTVFSDAELQAALAPFVDRPLTLSELLQARSAITQLYTDAGYISSGAFIPPQEPEDGTVVIQVIEGRLVELAVEGTRRLHPGYISSRLGIAADPPLQLNRLVDALRLLQLDPLIENISGELSAGLDPGTNRLTVQVEEADSFDIEFVTNNDRSVAVGSWERGLFINERNLLGLGDGLQIGYLDTDGSDRFLIDYEVPVSPYNTTVNAHFEYTSSRVIREPADFLDIQTDGYQVDLSVRHPVFQTPTEEFALSLIGSWNKNDSEFLERLLGESLPFPSFGANEAGEIETYTLRFAQDWIKRGRTDVIAARSQFNLGLGGTTPADLTAATPDGYFFSWLGQAQWARLLNPDVLLLIRGEAQLANDTLPTSELFSLGGRSTVRGYRQNRLLTDNALLATAEVRLPLLRDREREGLLQIIPFFDIGTGWNTQLETPETSTLIGTGIGLLWTERDFWTARLDWGLPLNGSESGNSWQEQGVYFSVSLRLF